MRRGNNDTGQRGRRSFHEREVFSFSIISCSSSLPFFFLSAADLFYVRVCVLVNLCAALLSADEESSCRKMVGWAGGGSKVITQCFFMTLSFSPLFCVCVCPSVHAYV